MLLLILLVLFVAGLATRSYVGVLVPVVLFACALVLYVQRTPRGDEVEVMAGISVIAGALGVLLCLGGVALGRYLNRPAEGTAAR